MTSSEFSEPAVEAVQQDDLLIVTINRPRKGNALSVAVLDALAAIIDDTATSTIVKAVVITGAGAKVFSAGADINNLLGLTAEQARDQMLYGQKVFAALEDLPQPVIAAINGIALGGGLELAMACDVRVAAETATLGQPEITLANLPGWAGTQRLPRLVGEGRALEMILTGLPITASRAYEIGLVNLVAGDARDAAISFAARMTCHASGALAAAKTAVYTGLRTDMQTGSRLEADLVGQRCVSAEQRAAVENFLNRKSTPSEKR